MPKTIFVVDDNATNLSAAREVLKEVYQVITIPSAIKMLTLIDKVKPDMILLDIEMPEMDGFEALHLLKSNSFYSDIPVIFLTGMTDEDMEVRGFQMGVVDFITKPFSAPILLNRIKAHLDIEELIHVRTDSLKKQTEQIRNLKNSIVFVLADMVEKRDKTTSGHIERTTSYLGLLIMNMAALGVYAKEISEMKFEVPVSSARLHDVGKIVVPDHILNKPDKLTNEEFELMKTHTTEGENIITQIVNQTESNETFLNNARLFAGYHHERWDGKGYPRGIKGTDIPLQGRIMAIADVYDALVSRRPYKEPFTHEKAVELIMEGSGTQFDPRIAEVFYSIKDSFKTVEQS